MAFDKTGEIKVFIVKDGDKTKTASKDNEVRYTVDDLVRDHSEEDVKSDEDELKNVHN